MLMGYLVASGSGCLVFTHGFRMVARGEEGPDAGLPIAVGSRHQNRLAGIGAAVFLLAFAASEALATIAALRH